MVGFGRFFGKSKHRKSIFWDCIFKGVVTGVLFGVSRWCAYNKTDLEIPYRYKRIPEILSEICDQYHYKGCTKARIVMAGRILMHFLTVDTAYSHKFELFIVKYYNEFYGKNVFKKRKKGDKLGKSKNN